MNNTGITEGMGKKIVEALKKQTEIVTEPIGQDTSAISMDFSNPNVDFEYVEPQISVEEPVTSYMQEETFVPNANAFNAIPNQADMATQQSFSQPMMGNFMQQSVADGDMDMPTNVAVLKQLITQLPTGVTKQTGAQIIKQTMEALGISMKSVLQEAQQVQEGLNNSTRECQANIIEYKRQIALLEKQTQQYQKQYAVLNDIISLFIQTNNY